MKSIVLFLSFRSSLLFAASLSSGEIGTFFALPEWMPRSVQSHDTPGSDPEDGSGWYVDECTNAWEWTEWMVEGRTAPIPTRNGTVWVLWGGSDIPKDWYRIIGVGSDPVSVSDPSNEMSRIEWRTIVYGYPTEDSPLVSMRMPHVHVAVREKNLHPVPTGRRVPRAARLTPEIQASVYATFDAYYERKYFTSQGQSNVWDTAAYGTRTLGPQFAFHKPDGYGDGFVYSPTNRQVATRRLVEYDNLSALARVLLTDYYYNRLSTPVVRPEWIENDQRYDSERMWWSTTAKWDDEVSESILPDFSGGRQNPTFPLRAQWATRMPVFNSLRGDAVVWRGDEDYYSQPGYLLMNNLSFGQSSGWDDYAPWWCSWKSGESGYDFTMRGLIETNYPSADGWVVTNATRRLVSDRLCCVNQVLGLMDRTYHMPDIVYPSVGTNTTYHNEIRYSGDTTCEIAYDSNKDEYVVSFGQEIEWNGGVTTNWTEHGSRQTEGSVIARRFSGTATNAGTAIKLNNATIAEIDDAWVVMFLRNISEDLSFPYVRSNGIAEVSFSPTDDGDGMRRGVKSHIWLLDEDYRRYADYSGYDYLDVSVTGATVTAFCNYHRSYSYARTWDRLKMRASQPGRDALNTGRVASSRAGAVIGTHRRVDNQGTSLSQLIWSGAGSGNKSMPLYWSKEKTYSGRAGIESFLRECESTEESMFNGYLGSIPTDWREIIPIGSDAERVRDSVSLDNVGIQLVHNVSWIEVAVRLEVVQGKIAGGHVFNRNTRLADGTYIAGYAPVYKYQLINDPYRDDPRAYERGPLAMDAKIGVLTRVDWDWKTLKRTDD